jgi:energy-coupling factor transport system substrate-specific component
MKAKFSITQKITLAAMLLVLAVFSTMFFKLFSIPGFSLIRFSITPAIIIYTSLFLGPVYGFVVGVASDLIPAFLVPTGSWMFTITIVYAFLGIVPWLAMQLTKRIRCALKKPWVLYGFLAAVLISIGCVFFFTNLFDSGFGSNPTLVKIIILIVSALLDVGLGFGLYFENKYFQKRILDLTDIPSPNEVALIVTITEVIVSLIMKSLAFWLYFVILNNSWPMPYSYFFVMMLAMTSGDILINTFTVSWMMIFTRRFIHAYGYPTIKEEWAPGSAADDNDVLAKKEGKPMIEEQDETKEDETNQKKAKIGWILFFTILALVMIACIIVIAVLKK